MKSKAKGLALIAAILLLSGCDEIGGVIESAMNKGTHKGVQLCVDANKTDILSGEATLRACIQKHEKFLAGSIADGLASIEPKKSEDGILWNGDIPNKSSVNVITHVAVSVILYDEDGKEIEFTFDIDDLWIEPGKKKSRFQTIEVEEFKPFHKTAMSEWCSDQKESEKYKNCKAFDFRSIKGVKISTD